MLTFLFFRQAVLFSKVVWGVYEKSLIDIIDWLNAELDETTDTPEERDYCAMQWASQVPHRVYPIHPEFFATQARGNDGSILIHIPPQLTTEEEVQRLIPLGTEDPKRDESALNISL